MSTKIIVFWLLLTHLMVLALCIQVQDICLFPRDSGQCKKPRRMWAYYYNPAKGQCEMFIYNSCGGNANRFKDKTACIIACVCSRPMYSGPCSAAFSRYYFNSKTSRCEKFNYGGCKSNGNNFMTKNDCAKTCHK